MRELEERLGLELIERLGKRAYATSAGAELIEYAHRIDRDVDDAMDAMRRRREGGLARVRIGTGSILLASLLPPVLRELRRTHPNIELAVTTGTSDEISAHVAQNTIDIGLVCFRSRNAPLLCCSFVKIRCWRCCRRANGVHRQFSTRGRLRGIR